jgi:hypothetical protein
MIMSCSIRIYTCNHNKSVKREIKDYKIKSYPVFLCKKCERKLSQQKTVDKNV